MSMNYYNQAQGYGRQMGQQMRRQMPYHNQYHGGMQMHGNRQFQGGYPNNFRLPQLINQNNQFQAQTPGINPMNPMQSMNPMQPMNPMNPAQFIPAAQQPAGPVTFEPYNPAEHTAQGSQFPQYMGADNTMPPPVNAPSVSSNASVISGFIQGEGNAFRFYSELREFTRDVQTRTTLNHIADNANNRKLMLGSLYNKMTGASHAEKDVPILKSNNLRQGIKEAIEIENNTLREMSALYDQIENGMHLKSLNSVIQKKLADIITLQQLAIYS